MNKKSIPQFIPGEKLMSRYDMPVTVLEYPAQGYSGGPYVKVRIANPYQDSCIWPPEWITRPGQTLPLLRGLE